MNLQISELQDEVERYNHAFGKYNGFVNQLLRFILWKTLSPLGKLLGLSDRKIPTGHSVGYIYRRVKEIYRQDGYYGVYDKIRTVLPIIERITNKIGFITEFGRNDNGSVHDDLSDQILKYPLQNMAWINKSHCILIVAEVTLPQCFKYRVKQKQECLEALGWRCQIVDWRDHVAVMSALQICKEVVFYRVPGFPKVMDQIAEAKRVGLSPWWEVDDLIFDKDLYQQCGFMETLPKNEKNLLLFGAGLFRKAMLACDRAIASTEALACYMKQTGVPEVHVVENALDKETCRIASACYPVLKTNLPPLKKTGQTVILYGSGTNTHGADFLVAAKGLLAALQKEPTLHFWVVGTLDLPEPFDQVRNQIRQIPLKSYEAYMHLLAQVDIAIAPLEAIAFNDAKSNIKFLEASVLGIPSVCSPQQAFRKVIEDGRNGFLASTPQEWEEKLLLLARNSCLRKQIGQEAHRDVLTHYKPETIMEKQIRPLFGFYKKNTESKLKVLVVNIYYDPYSYGGATLVAEAMNHRLQENQDIEITVFTSRPFKEGYRGLRRYQSHDGTMVYCVDLSSMASPSQQFNNLEIIGPFAMVLETVQPDIVHFHAIQNFGLHLLYACQHRDIPYIITLHDAWWLCNRQFMVKSDSKYCFQKKIDLAICQDCEPHVRYLKDRMVMMKEALKAASLLLSPSESHRQLYIANGIDENLIHVHRNGVDRPGRMRKKRDVTLPLRFGFVAGSEVVKGYRLIRDAFVALQRSDWQLTIVDNKRQMGHSPVNVHSWKIQGQVDVVPPYNETSKDDFFESIDVLLAPSQWQESYGLVIREALLRDVWVICTHPGGQSEAVQDGINGTLIPLSGNAETLKRAVENLLDRAQEFATYSNPFKDHIMTMEQQARELLAFYHQVKEGWGRKPPVS